MSEASNRNPVTELIERFDKCAATLAAYLKKVRERIQRFGKTWDSQPNTKELAKLLVDLEALKDAPEAPNAKAFIQSLTERLSEMRHVVKDGFGAVLSNACAAEQLAFRSLPDGFGVGPFQLVLNPSKEEASLSYAKFIFAKNISMDAAECVATAKAYKAAILDEPIDLSRFRTTLEEAIRVALARKNKSTKGSLRIELPAVYRELEVIHQLDRNSAAKSASTYSIPRFVVELSRLVQSEENIDSKKPLGLETAVLENTKDNRRSLFIPRDLACGFGEGTYYQALTLVSD